MATKKIEGDLQLVYGHLTVTSNSAAVGSQPHIVFGSAPSGYGGTTSLLKGEDFGKNVQITLPVVSGTLVTQEQARSPIFLGSLNSQTKFYYTNTGLSTALEGMSISDFNTAFGASITSGSLSQSFKYICGVSGTLAGTSTKMITEFHVCSFWVLSNATTISSVEISDKIDEYHFYSYNKNGDIITSAPRVSLANYALRTVPSDSGSWSYSNWEGLLQDVLPRVAMYSEVPTDTNYYPIRSYTSGLQISSYSGSTSCQLFVPLATSSQSGVVSTSSQTFGGAKTFAGSVTFSNNVTLSAQPLKIQADSNTTYTGDDWDTYFYPDRIRIVNCAEEDQELQETIIRFPEYGGDTVTFAVKEKNNYFPHTNFSGSLEINSDGSAWNEGIRIHPASNGWSGIVFCETSNSGSTNSSANTWSIHNNEGTFGFYKNGSSDSATQYLRNVSNAWYMKGGLTITGNISASNLGDQVTYSFSSGTLTITKL